MARSRVDSREWRLLRFAVEQGGVPVDQMARYGGWSSEQAHYVARDLARRGFVWFKGILAGEPSWVWVTKKGAAESGTGLEVLHLRAGVLERFRAVNEVRFAIEAKSPQARWVSRRVFIQRYGRVGPFPNGLVEVGRERHSVLVELRAESRPRIREVVEAHLERYDLVAVFVRAESRGLFDGLKESCGWDRVVIRSIPEPSSPRS